MLADLTTAEALSSVIEIAQQVFFAMAGLEVFPVVSDPLQEELPIASVLTYSEVVDAAILIECSQTLAYLFTSRLMDVPPPVRYDSDVQDAMGELVNMIGGNLKGMMPPQTRISSPLLLSKEEVRQLRRSSECLGHIFLQSGADLLCISLLAIQTPAGSCMSIARA